MDVYLLIKINPDAYLVCHLLSSDNLLIMIKEIVHYVCVLIKNVLISL